MNTMQEINIESCWRDEDEVKKFAKAWKRKYGIVATFTDGGDYCSFWTLEGPREKLLKYLNNEYLPNISKYDLTDEIKDFIDGK
jgi:hypothetical protein